MSFHALCRSGEPSTGHESAGNPSEPVESVGTEFSTGVDYQTDHDTYRVEQVYTIVCSAGYIANTDRSVQRLCRARMD